MCLSVGGRSGVGSGGKRGFELEKKARRRGGPEGQGVEERWGVCVCVCVCV